LRGVAVRVKLKVRGRRAGSTVETVALVNSGYEVEEPEILLPKPLAEYLNLPLTPPAARTLNYESPFGIYRLTFIAEAVDVELLDVDAAREKVHCTISPYEREVFWGSMEGTLHVLSISQAIGPPRSLRRP